MGSLVPGTERRHRSSRPDAAKRSRSPSFKGLIIVYIYIEAEDRVVVIAFHDARTSDAAIASSAASR
jgi:hypothetical protein